MCSVEDPPLVQGDALSALDVAQTSLSLMNEDSGALLLIFQCCVELGKTEDAKTILNRLVDLDDFGEVEVIQSHALIIPLLC